MDGASRRRQAAIQSAGAGYPTALRTIDIELSQLRTTGAAQADIVDAQIIRAELFQKLGKLDECMRELEAIDYPRIPPAAAQGYLLIRAKVETQSENLLEGRIALAALKDRIGPYGNGEINRVYLWRQAYVLGILGDTKNSRLLADEHRAEFHQGGFHEANSLLYVRLLPKINARTNVYPILDWREGVRQAGTLYVSSDVDFTSSLRHRGKSLCQALLTEAFLTWIMGNRFSAFRIAFMSALLLKHWQLTMTSEGIGELTAVFRTQARHLIDAVSFVVANDTSRAGFSETLGQMTDDAPVDVAFWLANQAVGHLTSSDGLHTVYDILDDRGGW